MSEAPNIVAPRRKWRAIVPNEYIEYFEDRAAAEDRAREITNARIEEWSVDRWALAQTTKASFDG